MAYDRKQEGHLVAQSSRADYRLEVGRAEVPVGAARGFAVLDPTRAAALTAWVSTLIPAAGRRPAAGEVGAAEYVDATVLQVPALRPALLAAIDAVDRLAIGRAGRPLAECGGEERERILREFEAGDASDAFDMVRDFTYEAYYGHPRVLAALEAETGWRGTAPVTGSSMAEFDASRLERVRALPPRWRQPSAGTAAPA